MKKVISIVLSLLILLPTICFAKDIKTQNNMYVYTELIPSSVTDFLSNNLPLLLDTVKENPSMYKIDENIVDSLYVGNGFNSFQYNNDTLENNNIYFFPLLYNGKIKAIVNIGFDGQKILGASLSTSLSEKINKIQDSKATKKPYIFISNNDILIIKNENYTINLSEKFNNTGESTENNMNLTNDNFDAVFQGVQNINLKSTNINVKNEDINVTNKLSKNNSSMLTTTYPSSYFLNIPCVSQKIGTQMHGMCWAAVVASITNYKTGTKLTAQQVCDDAGMDYEIGGTYMDSKIAYLRYNLYTDITYSSLTSDQIASNICNKKPVDMGLASYDQTKFHEVALRGYNVASSGMALSVMNSFTNRYEVMIIDSNYDNMYRLYVDGIAFYWQGGLTLR